MWGKRRNQSQCRFQKAEWKESTRELCLPDCGWYQIFTIQAEKKPDPDILSSCLNGKDRLALVLFSICAYREKSLDAAALEHLEEVLQFFRKERMDVILRPTYDTEGKGLEHEPLSFARVREHLEALGTVVKRFPDTVFVFQGLLSGSWGEMHDSHFLTTENMCQSADHILQFLGEESALAVRRPADVRRIRKRISTEGRIGLFDDGMFGSDTHLGTFAREEAAEREWELPWNREAELEFEENLCQSVPNGGEAVLGENRAYPYSLSETVTILCRMHISYLNRVYDPAVLSAWKGMVWRENGPWDGMDGYSYIGHHLGYRFRLVKGKAAVKKGMAKLELAIRNDGFASCMRKAELSLLFYPENSRSSAGEERIPLPVDLCALKSGETENILVEVPAKPGSLFLEARRICDGELLPFANESVAERGENGESGEDGTEKEQGRLFLGRFIPE